MTGKRLVLACGLIFLSGLAGARDLGEVEKAVRAAWDEHGAITADIALEAELPVLDEQVQVTGTGTSAYLRDGERDLYRQEITIRMPPPLSMEVRNEIVFDGDFLYLTNEALGRSETMQDRPGIENGNVPPGGGLLFDVLNAYMDLSAGPDTTVDGRTAYVVEGAPKAAYRARAGFVKAIFAIDQATGFLLRTELFDAPDAPAAVISASNLDTNPELTPAKFRRPAGFGDDEEDEGDGDGPGEEEEAGDGSEE